MKSIRKTVAVIVLMHRLQLENSLNRESSPDRRDHRKTKICTFQGLERNAMDRLSWLKSLQSSLQNWFDVKCLQLSSA